MTLAEIRPSIQALPHGEKVQLVQELMAELAKDAPVPTVEYPWWNHIECPGVEELMLKALEEDEKARRSCQPSAT